MIGLPSPHAAAAMLLAIAMFYGFSSGRLRTEIISLLTVGVIALGLYVAPLPGTSARDGLALAFGGFGHHALITICALMILGRGLVVTGALQPAARALTRVWQFNQQIGLLVTLLLALLASMMINDTPVLVLLLPILVQLAQNGGMPPSRTLIPVNSAILIGGMATTIGTSTNLLVVSIASDLGMRSIGIFHFTPIVLTAAAIVLPYVWLVMPRLLPDNSRDAGHTPRQFTATLSFRPESPAIGKYRDEIMTMLPADVSLSVHDFSQIAADSRITITASHNGLLETLRVLGAIAAPPSLLWEIEEEAKQLSQDLVVAELAIAPDSRLIGMNVAGASLSRVAVLGIDRARRHAMLLQQHAPVAAGAVADIPLAEADVLLVMGSLARLQEFARNDGLLMLEGGQELPRTGKATLALGIMGASVFVASIGLVPIAISALAGAIAMFVTGCVKFERVGRALSAQVIVLVAASIALGRLILVSGAADWLGQLLASGLQYLPAFAVVASVMLFVTLLTNFASNSTAAAVGTPIAFSLAQQLGMQVEPLVLAVLFGCNLCYATPVAYQTNMMILAEGDYEFRDYMRTGLPLVAIMVVTLSTILALTYNL